jgi:hypothetical protein
MAYELKTNLYRLSRPQLKKFVEHFSKRFPELYEDYQENIQRTYDRDDHHFGELPYSEMGGERETIYFYYALQMQGVEPCDAVDMSMPGYRMYVRATNKNPVFG